MRYRLSRSQAVHLRRRRIYIFKTTAGMNDNICYWAGAPYSSGAQIRLPERDRDPHTSFQFFTCHAGNWTRENLTAIRYRPEPS